MKKFISTIIFILLLLPLLASAECTCDAETEETTSTTQALRLKIAAIFSILIASAIGVSLPVFGKRIPSLHPESNSFFMVKAFAAGVILSTGFIHILPDAFENLTSPCLSATWTDFPFSGLFAMVSAFLTFMIDHTATSYYEKSNDSKANSVRDDVEMHDDIEGHVHVHTHASHCPARGSVFVVEDSNDHTRHKIISKVLELGIIVHSVVIGISLGANQSPETIKPLVVALTFHQLFEGMGLGGCISQADFKSRAVAIMILFFSLTTPAGIGIGMGLASSYSESSVSNLLCEGIFNSLSAGILIYMALVDLLAADFMHPKMKSSMKLQMCAYVSVLLGAACMTILAKWA